MSDRVTANLPSNDFERTAAFYQSLGFRISFKSDAWMILTRGTLEIEFFKLDQNPGTSCFSACIRVNDLDGLYAAFQAAKLSSDPTSMPRLTPPHVQGGLRMFALVDLDGSLLRCIENQPAQNSQPR